MPRDSIDETSDQTSEQTADPSDDQTSDRAADPRDAESSLHPRTKELETPVLLLAMPQVTSQPFQKSVVLLLRHDADEGSLGFIVNRPTDLKVADILRDLEIPWHGDADLPAYLGGPVNRERGTLLYTDADLAADESDLPGIAVSQSLGQLQELAEKPPGPFRLYLGYAGWGDGQLEQEILRNDWLIAPFDPAFLFSDDPEEVWTRAIRSVGIDPAHLPAWTQPTGGAAAAN